MTSHYLHVFFESAHVASIIPFSSEPTYFAMQAFGGYNMTLAFALAVAGGTVGQMVNWEIGRLLLYINRKYKKSVFGIPYEPAKNFFNKFGFLLLLLCALPLCNLITVAAGFVAVPRKLALPLIVLGEAAYYGYALIK